MKWKKFKPDYVAVHRLNTKHETDVEGMRLRHLVRGFLDCRYHFVIDREGNLHDGRSPDIPGCHHPQRNHDSIAVALLGLKPTPEQERQLQGLLQRIRSIHGNIEVIHL